MHGSDSAAAPAPRLNVIGAGKLGRTLARLWQQQGIFAIGGICNRTLPSAQSAQDFIGAGQACARIAELPDADCWLIATADGEIAAVAEELSSRFKNATIEPLVFHCSGALPASVLHACRPAHIASAHPVHSFADPERSLNSFAGSTVALEGDPAAMPLLQQAFAALDCKLLALDAEQKVLYHTGSVMACNYLTVLLGVSLDLFRHAGISELNARELLAPIVEQTVRNNFALGPGKALTGPIVRGDTDTVSRQLAALDTLAAGEDNPRGSGTHALAVYRALGQAGVELAKTAGLEDAAAQTLEQLLSTAAAER